MSTPRIPPGDRHDVGLLTAGFARLAGLVSGTAPPAVFLTLGHHKRLFRGWLLFAGRLMPGGLLPRRESELVILRIAHRHGSVYEWTQHVGLGRQAGVTDADLERLKAGPDADGWSPRERVLLTAVEELDTDGDIADDTWAELDEHLDDARKIELIVLAGHYAMLATALNTLRVQPDERRRTPALLRRLSARGGSPRSS